MINEPQSFWLAQALDDEQSDPVLQNPSQPLWGPHSADVCIVGGGYTGLWTAIRIKQLAPEKSVVVLEKDVCGAGASGRNGGCMLTLSSKYPTLERLFGKDEAVRLTLASEQAVSAIATFCQQHRIDAEIRTDGVLYTASNTRQLGVFDPVLTQLSAAGINHWKNRDASYLAGVTGSDRHLRGYYSEFAGSVQPARLVRGLARVAREMGVEIFEHSPMLTLQAGKPAVIITPEGQVSADSVVYALNAWTPKYVRALQRSIVLVSSDMMITEPMPRELKRKGLDHGMAIADSRIFVHYYRTTPDGRLMLGKGGNHFAFANRMGPVFDGPSPYQSMLEQSYRHFFPDLPCAIETTWTGASDRSVSGLPFFGRLPEKGNVVYGLGYSGNGIVQSYLGGKILASMALGLNDQWSHCGLAQGPLGLFPPEPMRWLGALTVRNAIRRKERREDNGLPPFRIDQMLSKLAGSAGKVDQ